MLVLYCFCGATEFSVNKSLTTLLEPITVYQPTELQAAKALSLHEGLMMMIYWAGGRGDNIGDNSVSMKLKHNSCHMLRWSARSGG